ncbi:molecular chaperone [Polaromonas sp. SM01]|uniref:fimbrial biogenesis chaperone n=1 Tax=Polaromonas sp. SM01 TaxID=3085630 RepID=UPI002981F63A|nr:molecular chaperone [Polaromonas sp. SM01]MDW5442469.1 molecular chaperone [Polaromonas sp. SM01]
MSDLCQSARPGGPAPWRWVTWHGLVLLLGLTVLLGQAATASAASLQVSPILLEFAPKEQAQSMWLSNTGTQPLRAQVRVQQWTQTSEGDQLSPTRALLASPPVVEIPPGEKQMIRIIRPQGGVPAREESYRLIVDELPSSGVAGPGGTAPAGLQFLLRYSVPVFVSVVEPVPVTGKPSDISALSTSLQSGPPAPLLTVINKGTQRVKISQLVHVDKQGRRTSLVPGLLGYVLAGQRMQWPLNLPADGTFKAKFNADLEEQVLPLAPARL